MGEKKYDETAAAMIGLQRYGSGVPFCRLEGLEVSLGIPLPASTQWEIVEATAAVIRPAFDQLIRQAGLYNDDTRMKILALARASPHRAEVEEVLKKAILHRKNSLFYKTENGAEVGDLFMSLIYTCELNGVNPFDYLTELQKHATELAENPAAWMLSTHDQQTIPLQARALRVCGEARLDHRRAGQRLRHRSIAA